MLVIRLRRGGKKHEPHYRIVVQEKRSKLGGKYIESLGHYHPTMPNKPTVINKERTLYWIKNGAELSVTVNNLLVKNGILDKDQKISKVYRKKEKQKEKVIDKKEKIDHEATSETNKESVVKDAEAQSSEEIKSQETVETTSDQVKIGNATEIDENQTVEDSQNRESKDE